MGLPTVVDLMVEQVPGDAAERLALQVVRARHLDDAIERRRVGGVEQGDEALVAGVLVGRQRGQGRALSPRRCTCTAR